MILFRLFFEFMKIGMFSIGGGMATLPFLYDLSDSTGWFTHAQIADMLAVSESTPGPIGINMATYVGYTVAGTSGSLAATIGTIVPGILLVLIITMVLDKFRNNQYVEGAFYGLRPASTGLITSAGLLVAQITFFHFDLYNQASSLISLIDFKAVILAVILLIFTRGVKFTKKLHPAFFISISAVVGIVFSFAGV